VEYSGSRIIEKLDLMENIVLNDPKKGCQHQEMSLLVLFVKEVRHEAPMFFQMLCLEEGGWERFI
jgi:hypothetical protein